MQTFLEFHRRISAGHFSDDEEWRKEVGYQPEDKDGGFKRWLELTGNKMEDFLDDFRFAVYGEFTQKAPPKISKPIQLEFEM